MHNLLTCTQGAADAWCKAVMCPCTGDHKAGELEQHMAGCIHSRGSAAQASLNYPVLASLPEPQEAHLCWLLTASGKPTYPLIPSQKPLLLDTHFCSPPSSPTSRFSPWTLNPTKLLPIGF